MEMFYVPYGRHWVDGCPIVCPRIISVGDDDCPLCQGGYDTLKAMKSHKATKEDLRDAGRYWLPQVCNLVNIYFPAVKPNPIELRGPVKYFLTPQTCFGHWIDYFLRDDLGDPETLEAFGFFFDESRAILYELRVGRFGDWNEYKTSSFVPVNKNAHEVSRPIASKPNGQPDMKGIKSILDRRHNLWLKRGTVDSARMEQWATEWPIQPPPVRKRGRTRPAD
jgi:hypothetical protein